MREIKFRAFCKRRKTMEYFSSLYWFEENMVDEADNYEYIIEQYTGLKDTEGKEIYEGDLLSRGEEYRDVEVQFRSACFWVGLLPLYQEVRHLKVVGNIHENKEPTVSNSQSRR